MPAGDYLTGLAFFAATWGGAAYVAATVERRLLPRLDPAPRTLALALLFLVSLLAVHVLPGAVGLLHPGWVSGTAIAAAVLSTRLPVSAAARPRAPTPAPRHAGGRVPQALAAVGVAGTAAMVLAAFLQVRGQAPDHVDAMSFALPGVADWIHSGSIWDVGAFLPLIQVRTYPNNGEVLQLAAMLPWSNDAFLRFLPVPLLGMTGLGVCAIGRELRAPAATAALFGALVVAVKVVAIPALYQLKPDVFMYATFSAGVLFLVRYVRTSAMSDLVLAGLGLGLALGARWYGLTAVVVVAAVWLAGQLVARRPWRGVLRASAVLAGAVLVGGGVWFLRDLILSGNPLYPVDVRLFGATVFHAPRDILIEKAGYSIADRLREPGFVRHQLVPGYRVALGLPGLTVGLGALAAALLALRRRATGRSARVLGLVAAAAVVALVYFFLPAGAQGLANRPVPGIVEANTRWLVPALILAAGAAAWAAARLNRGRPALEGLLLAALVVGLFATFSVPVRYVAAGVLLAAACAAALVLVRRPVRRPRTPVLAVAAVAAAAAVAVAGYVHQDRYNDIRYKGRDAAVTWVTTHAPAGTKVGMAGDWSANGFVPTYALYGPRIDNDVSYIGPLIDDQVRYYRRESSFRRALRRDGYQVLVVGRLSQPDFNHLAPQRTLETPRDARWARAAGFREVARDGSFIVLAGPALARRAGP